jgi:hypothetical protein
MQRSLTSRNDLAAWPRPALPILAAFLILFGGSVRAATVLVDGSQTYQVIEGFGVNVNHRSWTNNELQPVLDAFIDQAGMTLFRVIYDNTDWETSNSSPDPATINWNYYNQVYTNSEFQALWGIMRYLNQRGITNGVMVNFQGPGPQWMGGTNLTSGLENEWAKMIASLFIYARNTQHLAFSLIAPNNEPDQYVTNNNADTSEGVMMGYYQYTNALHCLAQVLDTNGMSDVRFVAPDSASEFSYLWQMMNDPVVMAKLAHVGLHSYQAGGVDSAGMYSTLQDPPFNGMTFWMTEFNVWCTPCEWEGKNVYTWTDFRNTAAYLLSHLANGASAGIVWEGYDSYYRILNNWSCWGLFAASGQYDVPKIYTPRKNFYTVAQISKFVRPGARRIGVSGSLDLLQLLAFYHPGSGQLTLTGVNPDSNPVSLSGTLSTLPDVTLLDLYYTDIDNNLVHSASLPVTNGLFTATVPADCVFTLVGSASNAGGGSMAESGKVTFNLTASAQVLQYSNTSTRVGRSSTTTNVTSTYKSTVTNSIVDSRYILGLLANSFNTNFVSGAKLALGGTLGEFSFYVVGPAGTNALLDVSSVLSTTNGCRVHSGTETFITSMSRTGTKYLGNDTETCTEFQNLDYDDTSLATADGTHSRFQLSGVLVEKYSMNIASGKVNDVVTFKGAGTGTIRGRIHILQGTVTATVSGH